MPKRDDDSRGEKTMPVTGEVGGEGGSYADGSIQGGEFSGPAGQKRVDDRHAASDAAAYAIRTEDLEDLKGPEEEK